MRGCRSSVVLLLPALIVLAACSAPRYRSRSYAAEGGPAASWEWEEGAAAAELEEESEPGGEPRRGGGQPHSIHLEADEPSSMVGTQSVLIATVQDAEGAAVAGARVEWMISEGSVGSFLGRDQNGAAADHERRSNSYLVTATNDGGQALPGSAAAGAGTGERRIAAGQTWCSITSPVEGESHVVAYCPDIPSFDRQSASLVKIWSDVEIETPQGATARVGTAYPVAVRVKRRSDGAPLPGQEVTFSVAAGSTALLREDGGQAPGRPAARPAAGGAPEPRAGSRALTVRSDAQGYARAVLLPSGARDGREAVEIRVVRPANEKCCLPAMLLGTATVEYGWVAPTIGVDKSGPESAVVNAEFSYTITVQAGAETAANGVVVSDVLPEGLSLVRSEPPAQVTGRNLKWSLGNLAKGATATVRVTVKAARTGKFANCAEVSAENGALKGRDCVETVVSAPQLALTKTAPATATPCDEIEYRYLISNRGDAPATGVVLVDRFAEGVVGPGGSTSFQQTVDSVAPGESRTLSVKVKASRPGNVASTATASAAGGLKAEAGASTKLSQTVLTLRKSGPERLFVGRPVSYELVVTNASDAVARSVVVNDRLPAGAGFVSASDGGRLDGGVVVWNLGDLPARAARKLSLSLSTSEQALLVNTATAQAFCAAEAISSVQTRAEGIPAILLEVIDEDDPVEVGSDTVYQITVTNQGSAPATNIVIRAILPPEVQYLSGSGATAAEARGSVVTFAPLPLLASKAEAVFKVKVKAMNPADIRFKVSMTSDQSSVPVEETESTNCYR